MDLCKKKFNILDWLFIKKLQYSIKFWKLSEIKLATVFF